MKTQIVCRRMNGVYQPGTSSFSGDVHIRLVAASGRALLELVVRMGGFGAATTVVVDALKRFVATKSDVFVGDLVLVVVVGWTKRNGIETVAAVAKAKSATRIGMSCFLRRWRTRGRFTVS